MPSNVDAIWAHAQRMPDVCEESCRAKISRAYYALFHEAKAFHDQLPSEGLVPTRPVGVHKRIIHQLCNPTVADERLQAKSRRAGTKLGLARELRDLADYRLEDHVVRSDANDCLGYVRRGLSELRMPVKSSAA
ncbi:hypothetical protein LMG32289_04777 [Cupriavidus pampae]|uniref:HEPN domain-containing protein n=1 Tax=Cupriavidus pampae TaxID=659251 RepID=A0ABN7Z4V3_9BURK|nr:hypothetical protein LMG32289_04777 [Cupriavidus pampae]